jgi:3-oxoacyl-[acyl-carrier-protein] synthase II
MRMAGLKSPRRSPTPPASTSASGIGGFDVIEREHSKYLNGGPGKISPFFIPAAIINLASGHVSIRYGAQRPELRDGHGLLRLRARHRRRLSRSSSAAMPT